VASEDRFKSGIVATLAKRAANRCSNPDCLAITSGPAEDRSSSVNVGEAAHIYGANPGSARYDAAMQSVARASIENAIWLCGNCHKLVDDDPEKYPAGLLFEWLRGHEQEVALQVGKAGAELRRRYEDRHVQELGKLSYLAERIVREKGDHWEYHLTAEVLRAEMAPVLQRWDTLKRGLYMKPNYRVAKAESGEWMGLRLAEIQQVTRAFSELTNVEFARAWGAPGVAGDEALIISTCRLFAGVGASALEWEEAVRFAKVDDTFEEVWELLVGVGGGIIEEAAKVPDYLGTLFADTPAPGQYALNLTLDLPAGWSDAVSEAISRFAQTFHGE